MFYYSYYNKYSYSNNFSNADIHWHLWNEVIEKIKKIDVFCEDELQFHIDEFKKDVYNSMVRKKIITFDNQALKDSLKNTLCVLCSLNVVCSACPLESCNKHDSLYMKMQWEMELARLCRSGEIRDYVTTKTHIEKAIKYAEEIRDCLINHWGALKQLTFDI